MSTPTDTVAIDRRRVLQGVAWATPAIVLAVATPPAAASGRSLEQQYPPVGQVGWGAVSGTFVTSPGFRTMGWTPLNDADTTHANQNWGLAGATELGFLCMDDNGSYTAPAIMHVRYSFAAVLGVTYAISYNMFTGWGSGDAHGSSRQSVVVSIQEGAGAPVPRDWVTVGHGGANPAGGTTDAQKALAGYDVVAPTALARNNVLAVTATANGIIYIDLVFTIDPLSVTTVSDDILVSQPVVTAQN